MADQAQMKQLAQAYRQAMADGDDQRATRYANAIRQLHGGGEQAQQPPQAPPDRGQMAQQIGNDFQRQSRPPMPAPLTFPNPISPAHQMNLGPGAGAGMTFLGRGVDNIVKGTQQVGNNIAEMINNQVPILKPETFERHSGMIRAKREEEDRAFMPLAGEMPAAAAWGTTIGETAPFLMAPVSPGARLFSEEAKFIGRGALDFMGRASGDAALAAGEAGMLYADSEEERADRMRGAAAGAGILRGATDTVGRLSSTFRRDMYLPEDREMRTMADNAGIPLGEGTVSGQLAGADTAARGRMFDSAAEAGFPRGEVPTEGAIASQVTDSVRRRSDDLTTQANIGYNSIFESAPRPIDDRPIRELAADIWGAENAKGTLGSSHLKSITSKWARMPEGQTPAQLHEFRSNLRAEIRDLDSPTARPDQKRARADLIRMEQGISDVLADSLEAQTPGAGDALRSMDRWYRNNIVTMQNTPQLSQVLGENAEAMETPTKVLRWMMTTDPKSAQRAYHALDSEGKVLIRANIWRDAYQKSFGPKGEFSPTKYARSLEQSVGTARQFLPQHEVEGLEGMVKIMRYISNEGMAPPDSRLLRMIRGFPFIYRAVTDQVRKSNTAFNLARSANRVTNNQQMDDIIRNIGRVYSAESEAGEFADQMFEPENFGALHEPD